MYVCIHVCMYVCMYVCLDVCLHVCMHVCMYYCNSDIPSRQLRFGCVAPSVWLSAQHQLICNCIESKTVNKVRVPGWCDDRKWVRYIELHVFNCQSTCVLSMSCVQNSPVEEWTVNRLSNGRWCPTHSSTLQWLPHFEPSASRLRPTEVKYRSLEYAARHCSVRWACHTFTSPLQRFCEDSSMSSKLEQHYYVGSTLNNITGDAKRMTVSHNLSSKNHTRHWYPQVASIRPFKTHQLLTPSNTFDSQHGHSSCIMKECRQMTVYDAESS